MHPLQVQRVKALHTDDYAPCIAFAQGYLEKCAADPLFLAKVLSSDEASFTSRGIFNTHNAHMWTEENPRALRCRAAQTLFSVNVWVRIIGDHLIGLICYRFV